MYFAAGKQGPEEAGEYEFWVLSGPGTGLAGRCRIGCDPGDRFRGMEGKAGYEKQWELALRAESIRPAVVADVELWLDDKEFDAPHAQWWRVGEDGARGVVVKEDHRWCLSR